MKSWALEHTAYQSGWLSALIGATGLCIVSILLLAGGLAIAAIFPILALVLIGAWSVRCQVAFTKVYFREHDMIVHCFLANPIVVSYDDVIEVRRTFVKNYSGGSTGQALLIRFRQGAQRTRRILPGISSVSWADALIEHIRSQKAGPTISREHLRGR